MGGWSGRSWDADLTGGASWGDVAEARGGQWAKKSLVELGNRRMGKILKHEREYEKWKSP